MQRMVLRAGTKEREMRALVVEDDPVSAKLIDAALKSEGIICEPAESGEDAIDLAKHYDFDIMVLDLRLPDMEGFEVVRRLRAAKVRTPVLILSGLNETDDKVRGLAERRRRLSDQALPQERADRADPRDRASIQGPFGIGDQDRQARGQPGHPLGRCRRAPAPRDRQGIQHSGAALAAQGHDADQGDVPRSSLWRHRRAGAQDHRRVHLQAAQEDRRGDRRLA